jgi:hypothetical protein
MRKLLLIVLSFCFSSLSISASSSLFFSSNLLVSAGKDTLEVKAKEVVEEAKKIFEETEEGQVEERRNKLSQFTSEVTQILSKPFTKTLTKVTLINMELTCSMMPDLESAGFGTFSQSFILLEVLGENVDPVLISKALTNKRNDWKFRWLLAEMVGDLQIREATDAMMEVILDKSDDKRVRHRCILDVPAIGDTYNGQPIGEYIIEIFKKEKELRNNSAYALGYLKYTPAIGVLLEYIKNDTSKMTRVVMVRALGYIGDKKALQGMFSLLKEEELKPYVAEQIGKIGGEEAVDTLINIVERDIDSFVRYCALNGLAFSGNERAYDFLIKRKEIHALGNAVVEGNQTKALETLKEIKTPEAVAKIRWLSKKGTPTSEKIKVQAKDILEELGY